MNPLDKAILGIVQRNNQLSHGRIGEQVGLSASSVKRRLAKLRKEGIIVADVALTDPSAMGITVIVQIVFEHGSKKIDRSFRTLVEDELAVSQCYSIAGPYDYLLFVHAATPEAYEQWAERTLMDNTAIRRFSSVTVWSRTKFTPVIEPAGAQV